MKQSDHYKSQQANILYLYCTNNKILILSDSILAQTKSPRKGEIPVWLFTKNILEKECSQLSLKLND